MFLALTDGSVSPPTLLLRSISPLCILQSDILLFSWYFAKASIALSIPFSDLALVLRSSFRFLLGIEVWMYVYVVVWCVSV